MQYTFSSASTPEVLSELKQAWLTTLHRPQDGMWASFRDGATQVEIKSDQHLIGYACVDTDNVLTQFFVAPSYLSETTTIFEQLLEQLTIQTAIVGTNNPIFLTTALQFNRHVLTHTYLFEDEMDISLSKKEGELHQCNTADINRIVDFCHYSVGAPKEWLTQYIGDLVGNGEVYVLEQDQTIIGTCEVRRSTSATDYADIGMIVSPDFRKQGYGTYLLHCAKAIAHEWGKAPICSCEKGNIGSLKSIHSCGFRSSYQLLSIAFQ